MTNYIAQALTDWRELMTSGLLPVMQLELKDDNWLLVDFSVDEEGITFSFDTDNLPVYFDGDVQPSGDNTFLLPWPEGDFSLDSQLELISGNINDGYILPNNLYPDFEAY